MSRVTEPERLAVGASLLSRLLTEYGEGAISRETRESALRIAQSGDEPTQLNRYWRLDYARLDLGLTEQRRFITPTYTLSAEARSQGVLLCSLAEAALRHGTLLARGLGAAVDPHESRFAALATAFAATGFFLYVPAGVQVHEPIVLPSHIPSGSALFTRNVIVLEEGATASIVEHLESEHSGEQEGPATLCCGTWEYVLERGARLTSVGMQRLDPRAQHFATRRARLANAARLETHLIEFGAAVTRIRHDARLEGFGATAETTVIFFAAGAQYLDITNEIEHRVGGTTSETVVKGAATDTAQGRYYGNIRMLPQAHGSVASLRDDAMLLSPTAHIDAVPALEIAANDVQAFHGATVGALDAEQRYYLMSRGITAEEAERLIMLGFFEPAIARLPDESLRHRVRENLMEKIAATHART